MLLPNPTFGALHPAVAGKEVAAEALRNAVRVVLAEELLGPQAQQRRDRGVAAAGAGERVQVEHAGQPALRGQVAGRLQPLQRAVAHPRVRREQELGHLVYNRDK